MREMDDRGYDVQTAGTGREILNGAIKKIVNSFADWNAAEKGHGADVRSPEPENDLGWRRIPTRILEPPAPPAVRPSQPWHILDDVLADAPVHRINVALAIVMAGYENVFNCKWHQGVLTGNNTIKKRIWSWLTRVEYWNPYDRAPDFVTLQDGYLPAMPGRFKDDASPTQPLIISDDFRCPFWLDVPVIRFKNLNLVERDEVESLRAISNLFRSYQEQVKLNRSKGKTTTPPSSIAIFGAPGTGKSYMVKQLVESVARQPKLEIQEFNVAQFADVADLERALIKVSSSYKDKLSKHEDILPLVFFDEFDCAKDNTELGWLKYFLAPMQDGRASDGSELPPAIFVFAGGLHASFWAFDPRTDLTYNNLRNSPEYQDRLQQFTARKGPDFISRLRGHVDVLPINDQAGRPKHFIRRAMVLRSLLESAGMATKGQKEDALAKIDPAIVYALLTTDVFRHGLRSIQAILEMCTRVHDEIQIASLPSPAQLDMHVDATEFMVRVHRGRARTLPEWQSENSHLFRISAPGSEPNHEPNPPADDSDKRDPSAAATQALPELIPLLPLPGART